MFKQKLIIVLSQNIFLKDNNFNLTAILLV